jgi:phosphoserine phosphatase
VILFDLNGTLTDPAAIGRIWTAPGLGADVLGQAIQSAMVETILQAAARPFVAHIEAALEDEVS